MSMDKQYCYGKASSLINAIENRIGFDTETGLIKDGSPEGIFLDTFENASLAIAYVLQGKAGEAKKILEGIRKFIGVDPTTNLFFNKKGQSKNESKKILPGEKIIYLSNQALVSILLYLLGNVKKAKEILKKYEIEIGKFDFKWKGKTFQIYKHGKNLNYFYPFNNLLVGINKFVLDKKKEAQKLVDDICELCLDKEINLLRANPKDRVFFTLTNALFSTYLSVSGKFEEASRIIKLIEQKIGFDKKTGLAFEGFIPPRKIISNTLTYVNTQLAISYLALAGMW